MSTIYDMRLTEHGGGLWEIDPAGISGLAAGQRVTTSYVLASLLDEQAPLVLAGLLGVSPDELGDVDIRFVDEHGRELARRSAAAAPPGKHHYTGSGSLSISPVLQRRIDELETTSD